MALTELKRWSTTILKPKSAADSAQVPGNVATVDVYRRGASVNTGGTCAGSGGTLALTVFDIGSLVLNDTVQVGTSSSSTLTVTVISSGTSITVRNDNASSIVLSQYDRLVITSSRPSLYRDVTGADVLSASGQTTTTAQGYVAFYTSERFFDYITSGSGLTTSLFIDEESGQARTRRKHYNVMDFKDTAAALAAVPAGRAIYFPADGGPYTPPSAAGWDITKPVELFSDGLNSGEDKGFQPYNQHKDSTIFNIKSAAVRDIYFHDLVMSSGVGFPAASGTGDHIRFTDVAQSRIIIERCWLLYAGRSGIYFDGSDYIVGISLRDVHVYGCGGHGIFLDTCTFISMSGVGCSQNKGMGAVLRDCGSGVSITGCNFESNGERLTDTSTATLPEMFGIAYNAQLYLANTNGVIYGCNIEDAASKAPTYSKNSITLNNCRGTVVGGCEFDNPASVAGTIGIQLINGTYGCTILSNRISLIAASVNVNAAATEVGNVIYPQAVTASDATGPGLVVQPANTRNFVYATNAPSGVSDNKGIGLLLPNLNSGAGQPTTDIDSSVRREGLLCYNSADNKLYLYDGTNFVVVGTQS